MAEALDRFGAAWCRDHLDMDVTEGDPVPQLADGAYLNLPESVYFAQKGRLGSTDHARLFLYEEGWWWMSEHNPYFTDASTKAQVFGSALHCLLLEGPRAFRERYVVGPDPLAYPDAIRGYEELLSAAKAADVKGARRGLTHKTLADLCEDAIDRPIWFLIEEQAQRAARGRAVVPAADMVELETLRDACLASPRVSAVVHVDEQDVRLAEVSVLYSVQGIPCRFRFDLLTPSEAIDLKTLGGFTTERTLDDAISRRLGSDALDVQAAMGFEARIMLYGFIVAGALHGGSEAQRAFLEQFPARAPMRDADGRMAWSWAWVFYQRPDGKGRAPVVAPMWMPYGGPEHYEGCAKIVQARGFYRAKLATTPLSEPWSRTGAAYAYDGAASSDRIEAPIWSKRATLSPEDAARAQEMTT